MLKQSSPWFAGYSLPKNVWDESRSGGAIVTRQAPRGRGAARHVNVTRQMPRGWISARQRSSFAGLGGLDGDSLEGSSLGYWGESTINKIGKGIKKGFKSVTGLACKISSSKLAQAAPGGNYVSMVNGLCPKGSTPATPPPDEPVQDSSALGLGGSGIKPIHLAIGGGLVALLLLVK